MTTKTIIHKAITLFEQEDTPARIRLLLDYSGSMETKLPNVIRAISAFASLSNPKDEISVADFADTMSVELMGGKVFRSDPAEIVKATKAVSADGRTALYDAGRRGNSRSADGPLTEEGLNHNQRWRR